MFTTGQLLFAGIFFVLFIIVLVYSYRGNKKLHGKHYKGSIWVLVGFLVFVALLIFIKNTLNP